MLPAAGVPARAAVPSPLSVKVTPLGRAPDSDTAGVGIPVEVTVKLPALPSVSVVLEPEVIEGATPMVTGLFEALADGPVPTVETAATEKLYETPLVRPVRVSEVAVELKVWLTVEPAPVGVAVTV